MSTVSPTTAPDYAAVTGAQQKMWASGDYGRVATLITICSEQLIDAADLPAGSRVLDVAAGTGSTSIAAARAGCDVVGLDYVAGLLDQARDRAEVERLPIRFVEGDAQALPFADASFDAVVSMVGVMFAPDHERAAAELLRVCRPGGTIALGAWTPDGFIGQLLKTVGAHVPPPPGVRSPALWGTQEHVESLFGEEAGSVRTRRRTYTWRFTTAAAFADFFLTHYGPTYTAYGKLDADGQADLRADIISLAARSDRRSEGRGPIAVPADWLELVAGRR